MCLCISAQSAVAAGGCGLARGLSVLEAFSLVLQPVASQELREQHAVANSNIMSLLHRFLRLNDEDGTGIFTFVVTKSVIRDKDRDVTSKDFW